MKNYIYRLLRKIYNKSTRSFVFHKIGFHGDENLIRIVLHCLVEAEQFIETGTNVGSTLSYVSRSFPWLDIYSCEPDLNAYRVAQSKLNVNSRVQLYHLASPNLLYEISKSNEAALAKNTVFWLDAHGYGYDWPLQEEINFITHNFKQGYIFIDDFKVPGRSYFGWDKYNDQECSFEFIRSSINEKLEFSLYYPDYTERSSSFHPLRGWGLIEFGHNSDFVVPPPLTKKIEKNI